MNVLYIADPNSIHDLRWIHSFSQNGITCFVIPRKLHNTPVLDDYSSLKILKPIADPSVINPLKEIATFFYLLRTVRKFKINLIHIMFAEPNALWTRYKTFFNIPVVVTTRGTDILRTIPAFFSGKGWLNSFIASRYKRSFKMADLITCTSILQQQALSQIDENLRSKTILVRTGVDLKRIASAKENVAGKFKVCKPIILMPRNMRPLYHHEFTLQAINKLPESIKMGYSFVFVNSDGGDKQYCEKIKKLAEGIKGDFHFLPTLTHVQMLSLYKQAHLAVMNPLSDGSPVSAMEAMVSKLPVILGPLSYDRQIFQEAVFRLKNWDSEELAQLITEVLALSLEAKEALTTRAFKIISENADSKIEMKKVLEAYTRLCS